MHELTIRDTKKDLIKRLIAFEISEHLSNKVTHNTLPLTIVNGYENLPCTSSFRDPVDYAASHGFFNMLELGMITEECAERVITQLIQGIDVPDEHLCREVAHFMKENFRNAKYDTEFMPTEPSQLLQSVYYECQEIIYYNESESTNALTFEEDILSNTSDYRNLVIEVQNDILKLSYLEQDVRNTDGYDITDYYGASFSKEISESADYYFGFISNESDEDKNYIIVHHNPVRGGGFSCMN